jgi:hypothetical protein
MAKKYMKKCSVFWHWCIWMLVGAVYKHPISMWFCTKEVTG